MVKITMNMILGLTTGNLAYNGVMNIFVYFRFRQVQMHGDSKTAGLQNEMKLKSFELERLQMVHEDTLRNLSQAKLDIEKLEKKSEVEICLLPKYLIRNLNIFS